MATKQVVVLYGDFTGERVALHPIAQEFGYEARPVTQMIELENQAKNRRIAAVIVHLESESEPWEDVLRAVRSAAGAATKIILCHRADLSHERANMIAAGAFYTLLTPLVITEARQALGFIWAGERSRIREIPRKSTGVLAAAKHAGAA